MKGALAVSLLLAVVSNINAQANLFEVSKNGTADDVRAAVSEGADVSSTDDTGETPLGYAAWFNSDPDVVSALVNAGADVNAQDLSGYTPLMEAAWNNDNVEVLDRLLGLGADVNAISPQGMTALMYAARQSRRVEIVERLVDAGADVSARDSWGRTAFDYAQGNWYLTKTDAAEKLKAGPAETSKGEEVPRDGADGWSWVSKTDPMTDIPFVNFGKSPEDAGFLDQTALVIEHVQNIWLWGLTRPTGWKSDKSVTYRLGRDAARTETFKSDGSGWLIHPGYIDIQKFAEYPRILVRVENDDQTLFGVNQPSAILTFDLTGLQETIKMAAR